RCMDVFQSIPSMLLAIAIAASLGPGMMNAMIAIGISSVPGYARLIRGSILSIRESEYIEAARAITASNPRIILRHIIPNVLSPMLVQATLGIAGAIITAASLSFIGLGAQPPIPEWGAMIAGGRNYIQNYWYIVTFPGLAIMITVVSFNLVGDGVRDALDPRLSR
ncbi:MAG: ABC transporter permease, partial [Spirochaetaceae bacterium]|nr:ABC transporter permease [Spirochaetaceae bacterium]